MKYRRIWLTVGFLVLLAGEAAVAVRCTESPKPPSATKPVVVVPAPVADLTIGGAVRDVGEALKRWDDFIYTIHPCSEFVTSNCIEQAARDRVASALRAYIVARPKGKLSSTDTTRASASMIVASRNLVVAIADGIEYHK